MINLREKYKKERKKQLVLWRKMINQFFAGEIGESLRITEIHQIREVLDVVGKDKALNHTFMPSGGGLDLHGASNSYEAELIELHLGGITHLVKPESLTINRISDYPDWWYLRLNCHPFPESGVYARDDEESDEMDDMFKKDEEMEFFLKYRGEELVEISPGKYVERYYWDMNNLGYDEHGDEIPLPENARIVVRLCGGGDLAIFSKYAIYNQVPHTYDARHNKMSEEQFREYIRRQAEIQMERQGSLL